MLRQETPAAKALRILQIPLSAALLWGFFQPWSSGLGGPASALQLRERLEGPHKLSAFLNPKSRVSSDYRLAGQIWVLGAAEGAALISAFIPPTGGWPGLVSGLAATGTAWWAGTAIERYPFQKRGRGATLSLWVGPGLTLVALLRILSRRQ